MPKLFEELRVSGSALRDAMRGYLEDPEGSARATGFLNRKTGEIAFIFNHLAAAVVPDHGVTTRAVALGWKKAVENSPQDWIEIPKSDSLENFFKEHDLNVEIK